MIDTDAENLQKSWQLTSCSGSRGTRILESTGVFCWGCVIAASWIRSSCFSAQKRKEVPLSQKWQTEQFWGWVGLVKWRFSLHVLLVPDPRPSKGSNQLWALHWAEEQPWGSRKVAKKGILNTEAGSLPAVGCWGLAWMWCSSPFGLPCETLNCG